LGWIRRCGCRSIVGCKWIRSWSLGRCVISSRLSKRIFVSGIVRCTRVGGRLGERVIACCVIVSSFVTTKDIITATKNVIERVLWVLNHQAVSRNSLQCLGIDVVRICLQGTFGNSASASTISLLQSHVPGPHQFVGLRCQDASGLP
jgi:hypothetical protein